jgi:hypothetical protein
MPHGTRNTDSKTSAPSVAAIMQFFTTTPTRVVTAVYNNTVDCKRDSKNTAENRVENSAMTAKKSTIEKLIATFAANFSAVAEQGNLDWIGRIAGDPDRFTIFMRTKPDTFKSTIQSMSSYSAFITEIASNVASIYSKRFQYSFGTDYIKKGKFEENVINALQVCEQTLLLPENIKNQLIALRKRIAVLPEIQWRPEQNYFQPRSEYNYKEDFTEGLVKMFLISGNPIELEPYIACPLIGDRRDTQLFKYETRNERIYITPIIIEGNVQLTLEVLQAIELSPQPRRLADMPAPVAASVHR